MGKASFLWGDLHLNSKVSHNQVKYTEEAVAVIASELMASFLIIPTQTMMFRQMHLADQGSTGGTLDGKGKMVGTEGENGLWVR